MSDAYHVGAVAMQTEQRALEALANNIANVNTPGFKRAQLRFVDLVGGSSVQNATPTQAALAGVTLSNDVMVDQQGEIQRSGNPMDIAINGTGYIELMGPNGHALLWRGGTLHVGDDGQLVAQPGYALKAAITVPADATAVTITPDGKVSAQTANATAPVDLGQIALVKVNDPAKLQRVDGGLYAVADDVRLEDAAAGEDGTGSIVQGAIERSNVSLTDEMVQLLLVQRAYAANAQIVQAADQLMAIANELRR